jgi:Sodium/hydrogen exchanger family
VLLAKRVFTSTTAQNDGQTWTDLITIQIFHKKTFTRTIIASYFLLNKHFRIPLLTGLRGAIAFALVLLIDPHHVPLQPMFATTTIAVIYFTVFLQGITIKPLVKILNVKRASKRKPTMNERIHERVSYDYDVRVWNDDDQIWLFNFHSLWTT